MRTSDFDFSLPEELIAQKPAPKRDQSRLLVLHRRSGKTEHRLFGDLPDYLQAGDVLVLNDSRVVPARLRGTNAKTGGQFEVLLLEENATNDWWAMLRPGKRARVGTRILFRGGDSLVPALHREHLRIRDEAVPAPGLSAMVVETNLEGHRRLKFSGIGNILDALDILGEVPLPPYIQRGGTPPGDQDRARYQTVFARAPGSVAAPTAGLHFTESLLGRIRDRGVQICFLTLHVGLGTFAPVKAEMLTAHVMHEERFELGHHTAQTINQARNEGRRVVAVGTTTVRVLESLAAQSSDKTDRSDLADRHTGALPHGAGRTRIFIHPPFNFRVSDALLTNFHLPRSTLLMLASAFAAPGRTSGREMLLQAYAEAIRERYRFFSYGDAMLLL